MLKSRGYTRHQIHKHGFIIGGVCHQRLNQRKGRAQGARLAWNDILDNEKLFKVNRGWYRILKMPDGRGIGNYGGGDEEIGCLRMLQICFPQLILKKKSFRLKWMNMWIEGVASCEFGVSMESPLSIINPKEKCSFGLVPPKPDDDAIYEKMTGVPRGLVR